MNKSKKATDQGFALLPTVLALVIAFGFAASLLALSVNSQKMSTKRRDSMRALDVAEAGLNHAIKSLNANHTYAGQSSTTFSDGRFAISMTTPAGHPLWRLVQSTGTVTSGAVDRSKTVKAMVDTEEPPVMNGYAVLSNGSITGSGNMVTSSGPVIGVGNVHTNGNFNMSGGNAIVNGSATAVGSNSGGTVTGTRQSGSPVVTIPSVDSAALLAQAQAIGTHNGDWSASAGTLTVSGYVTGNLSTSGQAKLAINGLVYVHGSVNLAGQSYVGNGILIADGPISLSGGSGFTGAETNSLAIITLSNSSTALTISGQATVRGALYVPNGTTDISGQANILGSLTTKSVTLAGQATVVRDTNFAWPSQLTNFRMKYWQEG